jgi:hypothetical protein
VSFSALDDPTFACQPVTWEAMHFIATSGSKEECAAVSQHQCHNAFANIDIGDPVYKIFGSVPTDPMHSVQKGYYGTSNVINFRLHDTIAEIKA